MSETILINIKSGEPYDISIMRPGPYGNPYCIGPDGDRSEVIHKFRYDFYLKLKMDPTWKEAVEKLRGKRIACCCAPLDCHGNVYVDYFKMTRPDRLIG